jgi:hypothetical protein
VNDLLEQQQPLCALRVIDWNDRLVVLDAIILLRPTLSLGEVGI